MFHSRSLVRSVISSSKRPVNSANVSKALNIAVISQLQAKFQVHKATNHVQLLHTSNICRSEEAPNEIHKKIDGMVKSSDVFVFMKGIPAAPRCGFSNAVCQIMRMHDVNFEAFDVLSDEEIRQGTLFRQAFKIMFLN